MASNYLLATYLQLRRKHLTLASHWRTSMPSHHKWRHLKRLGSTYSVSILKLLKIVQWGLIGSTHERKTIALHFKSSIFTPSNFDVQTISLSKLRWRRSRRRGVICGQPLQWSTDWWSDINRPFRNGIYYQSLFVPSADTTSADKQQQV